MGTPRPWWALAGRISGGISGGPGGPRGGPRGVPGGPGGPSRGSPRGVSWGAPGGPGGPPGPPETPPDPPKMVENRPKKGPKMARKRAKIRPFSPLRWQSPGGWGAPPTTLILLRNQRRQRQDAAARRAHGTAGRGWPESPFGEVPRTARGAGRAQELVLRQEVRGLAPPGGYSLRHAGRVRLPTVPVLAALRPDRLTRRPDGHTTFLAARAACYPATGRHQRVSPTLGETLCWTSVHLPSGREKPRSPDFVPRGERSARWKKNFFPEWRKKNFFSSRKNFFSPEKISASEIFPASQVV